MQHVAFLYRGELLFDIQQRQHEADEQHRGGDVEHRAQTIEVGQQAADEWADQRTADAAG